MPNVEIKSSAGLTRKEAGNRLIELGNALVAGSKVELDWGQDTFKLGVANRVDWELEIEIEGSETELEIEISWRDAAPVPIRQRLRQRLPRRHRRAPDAGAVGQSAPNPSRPGQVQLSCAPTAS